ncbi:hypothetical protein [Natrinema caseinilyticum]|uniref:hypothetical protein n=1 Tax=Natrinema caseinilyticum TaxID=2961570 RepID=UPI0020C515F8|nr:hypothetical protein [Natrinema caseinilyticum]
MIETGTGVAADDEGAAALATVLRVAQEGDGTVTWAALDGEISREQWGALLAHGVLVPAGDRFVLADPTAVRETLEEREFHLPDAEG